THAPGMIIPAGDLIQAGSLVAVATPTPAPTSGATICDANGCRPAEGLDALNLPPALLPGNGVYAGTSEQAASLAVLQQQAVTATLKGHGLPASDTNVVLSWGRDDVLAELWSLVVQAIQRSEEHTSELQSRV